MGVRLFEHQEAALAKLHNGSILWGGVGSGKSVTGIAYYYIRVCDSMRKPKDLYIITTARKRDTGEWEGELARFGLSCDPEKSYKGVRVVVDSWNNIKKYVDISKCFFLFDEQRVVGYGAWTKAFLKITAKNEWILLSATPGDCWMDYLPVFIANGYFRNKSDFQKQHVLFNRCNTRYPQITGYIGERRLRQLRDEVLVGMSYEKKTVPHHETIISEYSKDIYDQVMKTRWNPYTKEPIREAAELCFVLRRIVNTDEDRIAKVRELLYRHPKAIIFYNFDFELELLRSMIMKINQKDAFWKYGEWNGHRHDSLPTGQRWIYLVQYTAGAEGWNCVETDTIIFFSQSYSYKTMVQAAGRIDRLNTGYHDLYYFYFTSNSKIDLAMRRALKNKKNFNESAFVGQFKAKN